jgi:quercetin dioxygenase-like cupin family protein
MRTPGYVKLISSVDNNKKSVVELNILPGERTPWHYHSLFSETFIVLKGTLEVGKGKEVLHLNKGDVATINPGENHYYHNVSDKECMITTTIDPGNRNFEYALFILKGLWAVITGYSFQANKLMEHFRRSKCWCHLKMAPDRIPMPIFMNPFIS